MAQEIVPFFYINNFDLYRFAHFSLFIFLRRKDLQDYFCYGVILRWTILPMSFPLVCLVIKGSGERKEWHKRLVLSLLDFSSSLSYSDVMGALSDPGEEKDVLAR